MGFTRAILPVDHSDRIADIAVYLSVHETVQE